MKLKFIANEEKKAKVGEVWRLEDGVRLIIQGKGEYLAIDLKTMSAMDWREDINRMSCVVHGERIGRLELDTED